MSIWFLVVSIVCVIVGWVLMKMGDWFSWPWWTTRLGYGIAMIGCVLMFAWGISWRSGK